MVGACRRGAGAAGAAIGAGADAGSALGARPNKPPLPVTRAKRFDPRRGASGAVGVGLGRAAGAVMAGAVIVDAAGAVMAGGVMVGMGARGAGIDARSTGGGAMKGRSSAWRGAVIGAIAAGAGVGAG